MKQSHLFALNTFVIWGSTVLQILPQLFLVPFLIINLGDSGYGEYVLVWSLLLAIEQLELSLQSGVTKYSAAFLAEGRIVDVNKVLSSTFLFSVFLGLLSFAFVLSIAFIGFNYSSNMFFSLLVVGFMMLLLVPTTPFQGIILAKQRHYIKSLADILSQYLGLSTVVLWFHIFHPSVTSLVVISVGTFLLSRLAQLPFAYRLVPGLHNSTSFFCWKTFCMIAAFGVMIVLSSLCIVVNTAGIRWLSGILVSPTFVAHLAILLMPGILLARIVQGMTITVMPVASAYQATQSLDVLRELFLKATRYIFLIVAAVMLVAVILLREVIVLWVGSKYSFLSFYSLLNLFGVSVLVIASCSHHMLKGFGELKKVLLSLTIGLVLVPTAVFVIFHSIWGKPYLSISLALALGNVTAGVLQTVFCFRLVKMNFVVFVFRAYLQPLMAAAFVTAISLGLISFIGSDGLVFRLLISSLSLFLLFGIFYFIIADNVEKRQFKELVLALKNKVHEILRKPFHSP